MPAAIFVGYLAGAELDRLFSTGFLKIVFVLIGTAAGFVDFPHARGNLIFEEAGAHERHGTEVRFNGYIDGFLQEGEFARRFYLAHLGEQRSGVAQLYLR